MTVIQTIPSAAAAAALLHRPLGKADDQSLAGLMTEQVGCNMHWQPEPTTTAGMTADGIHPSSEGYATRADGLSRRMLAAQAA